MNKIWQFSLLSGAIILTLSGCGFRPMYGNYSAASQQNAQSATALNRVVIETIPDRSGQVLRNMLVDRFYEGGVPTSPLASLQVGKLNETKTDLDLTKSSESTRAQLRLSTRMTLTDSHSGKEILTRDLQTVSSYNILESEFATRVTEDSARQSAIADLARQIELALSLYYNTHQQ